MPKTKEQRLQQKVDELLQSMSDYEQTIASQNSKIDRLTDLCGEYRERLEKRDLSIDSLQRELNRLNEEFEKDSNPEVQTIAFCSKMMLATFNKIKCPLTQVSVYQQFCAIVVEQLKDRIKHNEAINVKNEQITRFAKNQLHDMQEFIGTVASETVSVI